MILILDILMQNALSIFKIGPITFSMGTISHPLFQLTFLGLMTILTCETLTLFPVSFTNVSWRKVTDILHLGDNTSLIISGSGRPLRQFIYSKDLAKLILWTLFNYNDDPSPIILSVDEKDEVPISKIVELIVEAMDFKGEVKVNILLILV